MAFDRQQIAYLPGETKITSLRTVGFGSQQELLLTNQRLILSGNATRLFFVPGGFALASADLRDVDAVFNGKRFASSLLALVGLVLGLGALVNLRFGGGLAVLALLIGIGLILFWLLFSTSVIEFKVGGAAHFSVNMSSFADTRQEMESFIAAYYKAREARLAGETGTSS